MRYRLSERGEGAGLNCNLNIPLPAGCGVAAYEYAFDRVVVPALERFQPQLIIVPSGYDAGAYDPLGRMMMTSEGFRSLTSKVMRVADHVCEGKIVMTHEGGYSIPSVPFLGLAVLEQLSGIRSGVKDPFTGMWEQLGGQDLQPHQAAAVDEAAKLVPDIPDLLTPVRRNGSVSQPKPHDQGGKPREQDGFWSPWGPS
eukprot:g19329.t1